MRQEVAPPARSVAGRRDIISVPPPDVRRATLRLDIALLVLRIVVGVAFVLHGWVKLQHPTTWAEHDIPGLPAWLAVTAALVEFAGGIALVAGLLTRAFALLIACNMLVAIFVVHIPKGAPFIATAPGTPSYELPLVYLAVMVAFVLVGAGYYSLDAMIRRLRG